MTAAVTMVYNEPEFLPLWIAHYGPQFGRDNLYVIDHGSDDGSTGKGAAALDGVNLIRIPRTAKDNVQRTAFVTHLVTALLQYHDTVVSTDVDELLVADPARHDSLAAYCRTATAPVTTAIGLNVTQRLSTEPAIDLSRPIGAQRRWARFVGPMCKPVLVRQPVRWSSGFHSVEDPAVMDDLYLFHLRYYDEGLGLMRLARTRAMAWSSDKAGLHQRVEDDNWRKWFRGFDRMPCLGEFLSPEAAPQFDRYKADFLASARRAKSGVFGYDHILSSELFEIPAAFRTLF